MPAPIAKYATDRLVYDYICDPISKYICFIHPNIITTIGFLIIFPIIYNLAYHGNVEILILLGLFKYILDCLDGSVARACKTTSKIGKYLDITCDTLSNILIGITIWYVLRNTPCWWLAPLFILGNIYNFLNVIFNFNQQSINSIIGFIHDNTVILNMIWLMTVKTIIIYFNQ